MPVQSSLTLNTKVYTPRGKQGDIAGWALAGDTTFGGATSLVSEYVRGPTTAGVTRVQWKLEIPKAAAADSACACTGAETSRGICTISITVPSNYTTAERQDYVDRIQSLVALSVFDVSVSALEGSW